MKRSIVILVLMFLCFGLNSMAAKDEPDCFLKTKDKVYFGNDIKIGLANTRIFLSDGTVAVVKTHDITNYRHHDKMYMLLPVICDNNDTLCMAMMRYITSRAGLNIFQYCCPQDDDVFFEYKEGKFYRRLDADKAKTELTAMGLKVE